MKTVLNVIIFLCINLCCYSQTPKFSIEEYLINGKPYPRRYDINELQIPGDDIILTYYKYSEIPRKVSNAVKEKLDSRLGKTFASSLKFVKCNKYIREKDGETLDTIYSIFYKHPETIRKHGHFISAGRYIPEKEAGFIYPALLYSTLENAVSGIEYLPAIAEDTSRTKILKLEKILDVIANKYQEKLVLKSVEIRIDSKNGKDLIWKVKYSLEPSSKGSQMKHETNRVLTSYINAHSGIFVDSLFVKVLK